jgi:hypothetical protein
MKTQGGKLFFVEVKPRFRRKAKWVSLKRDKAKDAWKRLTIFPPLHAPSLMMTELAPRHPRALKDILNDGCVIP